MAVDPISIAVELAAGRAATRLSQRIAVALKRRACRRELAANLWRAVVAQSDGRLRHEQGHFDPDALWAWMTSDDVSAALRAADPAALRQFGATLRETWRAVTNEDTNALTIEDGQRAAELLFYLIVVDVLSGDGLVSTMASRILDAVESLHNDLALVCETLLNASEPVATSVRKLALMSERAMETAEQGLSRPGGELTVVGRHRAMVALQTAVNTLRTGCVLLVTGQPDVGKSHLAMSLARRMQGERDVIAVDLQAHEGTLAALEDALGGDLQEALTAMVADVPPVLVLDGAETVQTVGPDLLTAIVGRALQAGCQVLIVSRSDAELDIQHALAARGLPTQRHAVEEFSDDELAEVLRELPSTRHLAVVPMGAWVARRPGLVKAWLTLDSSLPIQNEGHLIELVRTRHIAYGGPGQASRLAAANALARAELGDALGRTRSGCR